MDNKIVIENLIKTLEMQDELNKLTAGENWKSGIAKNGKKIDWRLCILMETCELIDSLPWKHWKDINAVPDLDNVIIEIVDIWHFIASLALEENISKKAITLYLDRFEADNHKELDLNKCIEASKNMALSTNDHFFKILKSYLQLLKVFGISIDLLVDTYFAKNILNKFRQDNGYQEGTYQKIWDGLEDNVWAMKIIKEVGPDNLYEALDKKYKEITEE